MLAGGKYHKQHESSATHAGGPAPNVLAERLPPVPPAYSDSRYIFLANTHPAGQLELLASFPKHRLAVADTMDLWIETSEPPHATALELLQKDWTALVLNDSEAQLLTGETNLVRAAQAVQALGPKFVVIKKGEHGSMLRFFTPKAW